MYCPHCKQNRVHFDHNEYFTCSNCGQHTFKDFDLVMPDIPPAAKVTNNSGCILGAKTRALIQTHRDEITRKIIMGNSWRSVHQWLLGLTDHSFAVETLKKHARKMMAET